jgi:RNA polymerase sigma factor (sigma-70 family)
MSRARPAKDDKASETVHTLACVLDRLRQEGRGAPDLERALDRAFAKHTDRLRAYCRRELRGFSAEVVEEVTQDVLLEAWNKLPTYRAETRFGAFLWAIAEFKCANARRKRRDVLSEDGLLEVVSGERSVLALLSDEQRNELVGEAARNVLDNKEQDVVHLRWVLDYSYEDIASWLCVDDKNQLRVILQRCKNRMRKEIARLLTEKGHGYSFLRSAGE